VTSSTQGTTGRDPASTLDRRRDKAQTAKDAVDNARAEAATVDAHLKDTASRTRQHREALKRAQAEVARLKKDLKAFTKEHGKLTAARKKARAAVAKAANRLKTAEAKYDQVVLADIIRRERDRDQAETARPPTPSTAEDTSVEPADTTMPATVPAATSATAEPAEPGKPAEPA
jgi:chromosome segregation ATPase